MNSFCCDPKENRKLKGPKWMLENSVNEKETKSLCGFKHPNIVPSSLVVLILGQLLINYGLKLVN